MKAVTSEGNAMFLFFDSVILKISVYGFCILTVLAKLVANLFCISSDQFLLKSKNIESIRLKA